MTDQIAKLDLPGLQRRLDGLATGEVLSLASSQAVRLFGINEVGHRRLELFATGHGCGIDFTPSMVIFRKQRPTPA